MSLSLVDFHSVHVICLDHDPQRRVNCGECLFGLLGLGRPQPPPAPGNLPGNPVATFLLCSSWKVANEQCGLDQGWPLLPEGG